MDMLFLWQLRVFVDGLSIVAGCIIIGVSRECDADAVGGIFLGAGGLGEYIHNSNYGPCHFPSTSIKNTPGDHLIRWCNLRQLIAAWGAGYSTQPRRLSAVSESRKLVASF
uniref:Uncharacterized protein n=1 Tax=Salmo trutta TaxID=8032 RepID=A0A674DRY2_SALTR